MLYAAGGCRLIIYLHPLQKHEVGNCDREVLGVKRTLMILLSFIVMVSCSFRELKVNAETISSIHWNYNKETGTLTVSGTGTIPEYGIDESGYRDIKDNIQAIVVKEGITEIGTSAFWECYNCKSISLPSSVKNIGNYLVSQMSIKELYIPKNVMNIGFGTTDGCNELEKITVDSSNSTFYSEGNCIIRRDNKELLSGCPNSVIPNNVKSLYFCSFSQQIIEKDLIIPDSVTFIDCFAFGNGKYGKIYIPSSINEIDELAFETADVGNFVIDDNNKLLKVKNHCLITGSKVIGYEYSASYNIPEGITYISHAPSERNLVDKYVIPSTIKELGIACFFLKNNIKRIECKAITAPVLNVNSLVDLKVEGGFHVYKDAVGYSGGQWDNIVVINDLEKETKPEDNSKPEDIPNPESEEDPEPMLDPEEDNKSKALFDINNYSFSICNSSNDLGYTRTNPYLSLDSFKTLFDDDDAELLYKYNKQFEGLCMGMAVSSLFMVEKSDEDIDIGDFTNVNNARVSDLMINNYSKEHNLDMKRLFEITFVSQLRPEIQNMIHKNEGNLDELIKMGEKSFDSNPYVICIFINDMGGHAIVPLRYEEESNTKGKLYVYDCNYPGDDSRYIEITKNSAGKVTGYKYYINDEYLASQNTGFISYVQYKDLAKVWSERKLHKSNSSAFLVVDANNYVIKDESNKKMAEMKDGEFVSYSDDLYSYMPIAFSVDNIVCSSDNKIIYFPAGIKYSVETDTEPLKFIASNGDCSVNYSSTQAGVTQICVDSCSDTSIVGVDERVEKYNVTIKAGTTERSFSKDSGYSYFGIYNGVEVQEKEENVNESVQEEKTQESEKEINDDKTKNAKENIGAHKSGGYDKIEKIKNLKIKRSGKKAKISYSKVSGADGYQVKVSTNKKFIKPKILYAYSNKYTIKSLKKKKTYYVKVRAFSCDDEENKMFGEWSQIKKIKK